LLFLTANILLRGYSAILIVNRRNRVGIIAAAILTSSAAAKADVIIPSGTIITPLNTRDAQLPGFNMELLSGDRYKFTADTSCVQSEYMATNGVAADAFAAACNQFAGTFLGQNANGSVTVGKDDSKITIDSTGIAQTAGTLIKRSNDGAIQIGANANGVSITSEGVEVNNESLITKKTNGEIHIGKNSLITIEEGGVQKLYATDANGRPIPINVTNGTNFLIDGTNVKSTLDTHTRQINSLSTRVDNLGSGVAGATALSAAMTALPATSDDSPFSCGTGTGGYSNRYAMGFGCAARITDRLAFNAGGSFVFGGASNYGGGTLDNVAGRLGFVFKIGKLNPISSHAISKRTVKLESQLIKMKQENQKIISENQQLTSYLAQMKELLAIQNRRLENLETIAKGSGWQLTGAKSKSKAVLEVASISK